MVGKGRSARPSPDPASSEDDDEGGSALSPERYASAGYTEALLRSRDRIRALLELKAVVEQAWPRASKATRVRVADDVFLAASTLPEQPGGEAELAELVRAAARQLPKKRGAQLLAEHRKAALALHRLGRRLPVVCAIGGGGGGPQLSWPALAADDAAPQEEPGRAPGAADASGGGDKRPGADFCRGAEACRSGVGDLPQEVLLHVLRRLDDPCSLAAAAAACREWRGLAADERLWERATLRTFGARARRQPRPAATAGAAAATVGTAAAAAAPAAAAGPVEAERPWHARFCALARAHPHVLLPLGCNRIVWRGRLCWVGPEDRSWLVAAAPCSSSSEARQLRARRGLVVLSPPAAVQHLLARPRPLRGRPGGGSSGSNSSDGTSDTSSCSGSSGDSSEAEGEPAAAVDWGRTGLKLWALPGLAGLAAGGMQVAVPTGVACPSRAPVVRGQ